MWTVCVTVLLTLCGVLVVLNFRKPEKEPHHKVDHLFAIDDEQMRREMGTLLGPAIVSGNEIRPLMNGDEIFPAMLQGIRSAKQTITFETYIYWSGQIGEKFAEALIERVRAGVNVHLMLDWVGCSKMARSLLERMRAAGVDVERYHAVRWFTLGRLNNRTHRKILVIDGILGYTGGVGIADQWSGHAEDPQHWRDMHFEVRGPVVAQMQTAFLDNWIKTTGRVLHGDRYFPALRPAGERAAQMFMSSPEGGSDSMRLMYLTAITAAEKSIDIEAAYFIPDRLMSRELISSRKRGVRIRVLVPDKHLDSETVRIASKREWGPLMESGIEIYLYEPSMLHCKMLIFDRHMVSVGSTNFDMRSFELNDEASLNIYDDTFAMQMTETYEQDLKAAKRYSLDQWQHRSWAQKLAEFVLLPIRSQL